MAQAQAAPPQANGNQAQEGLSTRNKILLGVGAVVVGAVAVPLAVPLVVGALGFGTGGIVAGSTAASIMASYGGAVTAGSACAVMQSIGAVGLTATGTAIAATAGGTAGAGLAAGIAAATAKSGRGNQRPDGNAGDDAGGAPPPDRSAVCTSTDAASAAPATTADQAGVAPPTTVRTTTVTSAPPVTTALSFRRCGSDSRFEVPAGSVLLVVNVASRSFLASQLNELEELYREYRARGLVVLAFPSNDFGNEPGTEAEIASRFSSFSFPVLEAVSLNGPAAHPYLEQLKKAQPGFGNDPDIGMNFTKFLVDSEGRVVDRWIGLCSIAFIKPHVISLLQDRIPVPIPSAALRGVAQ